MPLHLVRVFRFIIVPIGLFSKLGICLIKQSVNGSRTVNLAAIPNQV